MTQSDGARKKRHIGRWIALVVIALVVSCSVGFAVYFADYYHAALGNDAYTESSEAVPVLQESSFTAFGDASSKTGFIFYPGAKVESAAYAPLMADIADQGILSISVQMPFNFAFFDTDAAARVMAAYPSIEHWFIGGHSLGGVVASTWAAKHADQVDGVIFLASYPSDDLSGTDLRALSLYGSEDRVLNRESYEAAASKWPPSFTEMVIPGANHGQFGNYGVQAGDGTAAISAPEQWEETARAIVHFIGEESA